MRSITLSAPDDFDGWRDAARGLAEAGVPPGEVVWQVGGDTDLFGATAAPAPGPAPQFSVPRRFVDLARTIICHRDPERFALLYELLLRVRVQPKLLDDQADPLMYRLHLMERSVSRDIHKMRAFVRFRAVTDAEGERFVAWFEPEHHIVRRNADFFLRRFASMRWSILTPDSCVHWDGEALLFTPGAVRGDAPEGDELEDYWRTYYASIFNPARLKVSAMTKEMPKKYWRNMPETALVPGLIAGAAARTREMIAASPAMPTAEPETDVTLASLRRTAMSCTRCALYKPATQTVFGEGPADADLMFVGEQPGDQEDLAGHPFVGPAGQLFDRALAEAGIDRARSYVTNAVKHFKFEPRGKRRIHSKPDTAEIVACNHWLVHERALVKPKLTVALGATAARALTGKPVTIGKARGEVLTLADGSQAWITVHPSFLLRIEDRHTAELEYRRFVADLMGARARLTQSR